MCEDYSNAWQRSLSCHLTVDVSKLTDGSWSVCSDDTYRLCLERVRAGDTVSTVTVELGEDTFVELDSLSLTVTRKKYRHRFSVGTVTVHLSTIPLQLGVRQQLELPLLCPSKSPTMSSRSVSRLHLYFRFDEQVKGDVLSLLPRELASKVASFLDVPSLLSGVQVSKEWSQILSDDSAWHQRYREAFPRASVLPLEMTTWRSRTQHARAYETLHAAVAAATSSDRVLLQPGAYMAGFAIRRFLTLSGDQGNNVGAIRLDGRGRPVALFWSKDGGCVEDIEMVFSNCQYGMYFGSPEGPVRIRRCILSAAPLSSVVNTDREPLSIIHVNRATGDLIVSDCDISCGSYASVIFRHSQGLLQGCRIHSTAGSGVVVAKASAPTIRHNVIEKCRIGVRCLEGALGLFDANSILNCVKSGIKVDGESNVTVSYSVIRQCVKSGLVVKGGGKVHSVGNEISHNGAVGVLVFEQGHVLLTDTSIHSQHSAGILAEQNSVINMEFSKVQDNRLAGIEIRSLGSMTAKNCEVSRNGTAGLYAHSGGRVLMEHCELWGHERTCIRVLNSSTVTVFRYNSIHSNKSNGFFLSKGAVAIIDRNELTANARGVHVVGCSESSLIVRNLIARNSRAGVIVSSGGCATFQRNSIINNVYSNIILKTGSYPRFLDNYLAGGGKHCVSIHGSGGLFVKNRLRTTCQSAFILLDSFCIFQENAVENSGGTDLVQRVSSGWWYGAMPQREPLQAKLLSSPLVLS